MIGVLKHVSDLGPSDTHEYFIAVLFDWACSHE